MTPERKLTLLVVDDELEICSVLVERFEKEGYQVFEAHDGVDALQLVQDQAIDIVVSDVRMPRMGGDVLLEKIQELPEPRPHVILVSAFLQQLDKSLTERYGVEVLAKSFELTSIVHMVEAVAKRVRQLP